MAPHWPVEVDVFSEPHLKMKKLVHKYSNLVLTTDFTDEYHMTSLLQNLINVFCELKAHEEIENALIMRNLKRKLRAAAVTSAAVCNCHNDNRLTDMLEMVVHGSRSCWTKKSVKERQSYGHSLQKALEDFTKNFIPHMEEEEEVFQPMLMQYFSYEELKDLKAKVIHEHLIPANNEKYIEDLYQGNDDCDQTLNEPCYFELLPNEICEQIFSYLNPQDLCRSAQTCRRWNLLAKDPSLWTGIYPVHWATGNWTFHPEPLGGVDGAGQYDDDLICEFDQLGCEDEDADVDESSSDNGGDAKDNYEDRHSDQVWMEVKMLKALVKRLLPRVGSGVKTVDLAYSKGINSSLVHKILKLCRNVEVLDLTNTQVEDSAFNEYGVSRQQSQLQHLDLTNCRNITDRTLFSLIGLPVNESILQMIDDNVNNAFDINIPMEKNERDIETSPRCCFYYQRPCFAQSNSIHDGSSGSEVKSCSFNSPNITMQCPLLPAVSDNLYYSENDSSDTCCDDNLSSVSLVNNTKTDKCSISILESYESDLFSSSLCNDSGHMKAADNEMCCVKTTTCKNKTELYFKSKSSCCKRRQKDSVTKVDHPTRSLSQLQYLSLNGCFSITDYGLRVLAHFGGTPNLRHLDLSGCILLTGDGVQELVKTCGPQFDHANLFYCDNIPSDPHPTTASGCRNRGCATRFCCSAD